jgi:hypothetical protein
MALLLKQILDQLGALKNHNQDGVTLVVVLSMFLSFSLVVTSMMGNSTRRFEPAVSPTQSSAPTNRM